MLYAQVYNVYFIILFIYFAEYNGNYNLTGFPIKHDKNHQKRKSFIDIKHSNVVTGLREKAGRPKSIYVIAISWQDIQQKLVSIILLTFINI